MFSKPVFYNEDSIIFGWCEPRAIRRRSVDDDNDPNDNGTRWWHHLCIENVGPDKSMLQIQYPPQFRPQWFCSVLDDNDKDHQILYIYDDNNDLYSVPLETPNQWNLLIKDSIHCYYDAECDFTVKLFVYEKDLYLITSTINYDDDYDDDDYTECGVYIYRLNREKNDWEATKCPAITATEFGAEYEIITLPKYGQIMVINTTDIIEPLSLISIPNKSLQCTRLDLTAITEPLSLITLPECDKIMVINTNDITEPLNANKSLQITHLDCSVKYVAWNGVLALCDDILLFFGKIYNHNTPFIWIANGQQSPIKVRRSMITIDYGWSGAEYYPILTRFKKDESLIAFGYCNEAQIAYNLHIPFWPKKIITSYCSHEMVLLINANRVNHRCIIGVQDILNNIV